MGHRRFNNEGTIFYRENRREWVAAVSLDGRRLYKYGKSQRDCREWLKETLGKIEKGLTYHGTQVTLARFTESWLEGKALSQRTKTVEQYRYIVRQQILPTLGALKLQEITPAHLKRLYLTKKEEGTGARTVQMIHAVMYTILHQALKEGILGRNPAEAVDRPKVEKTEMKILTEEQARQLVIGSMDARLGSLIYLALMTGMREGELLGLQWSDVDWGKGILRIERQLQRYKGLGTKMVPPKTKAGRRQIKLGEATLERLSSHKREQARIKAALGDRWEENELIFPNNLGKPMACENLSGEFKALLKKNGLPAIRFHDLRHTSISFLLDMGTPVNTVQRRAGHSKASVTTDTYGHSLAHSEDEAAVRIEELITPVSVKLMSN